MTQQLMHPFWVKLEPGVAEKEDVRQGTKYLVIGSHEKAELWDIVGEGNRIAAVAKHDVTFEGFYKEAETTAAKKGKK